MDRDNLSCRRRKREYAVLTQAPNIAARASPEADRSDAMITARMPGDARLVYRWCERWTATLCGLRKTFDGDLDQYLLLFVFIQSEMARGLRQPSSASRREGFLDSGPRGLNALSIAQICGIPRETTRRKLAVLVKKGFLVHHADGLLYLTDRYRPADALGVLGGLMEP